MGQKNSKKLEAIVDEIVKNDIKFNLKTSVKREKEKADIADKISSAIAVLNDVGKELVLQELSINTSEKFKDAIDSRGNIDFNIISQKTTMIIDNKVKEAEKKGINIRNDKNTKLEQQNEKIEKLAILSKDIENYNNLSISKRKKLINQYTDMTNEQRKALHTAISERYNEVYNSMSEELRASETVKKLDQENKILREFEKIYFEIAERANLTEEEKIAEFTRRANEYGLENSEQMRFINEYFKTREFSSFVEIGSTLANRQNELQVRLEIKYLINAGKFEEAQMYIEEYESIYNEEINIWKIESKMRLAKKSIDTETSIENDLLSKQDKQWYEEIVQKEREDNSFEENYIKETFFKDNIDDFLEELQLNKNVDINSIMTGIVEELSQNGYHIDMNDILKRYRGTLESFDKDDIEIFKNGTDEKEKQNALASFFIEDGIREEVAILLSKIDYNGQLYEILGDENRRIEFFGQLDQLIVPTQETSLTDAEFEQGLLEGTLEFEEMLFEVQERTEDTIQEEEESIVDDRDEHEGTDNRDIEEQEVDAMSLEIQGMEEYFSFLKTTDIDINDLTEEANTIKAVSDPENERVNDEVDK